MPHPLDELDLPERYTELFTDAVFFAPYVEEACRRHGIEAGGSVRVGVPGSCPAFIAGERALVKFFGRLYGGARSYPVERAAARLLARQPVMPVPSLLGGGALEPPGAAWHWPYLIFEFIPGVSFGEVRDQIGLTERLRVARQVGGWLRALHALPIPPGGAFAAGFEPHLAFLESQRAGCAARHRAWGTLPAHLLPGLEGYLLPAGELIMPGERPHIIHADLTADHLLGRLEGGRWNTLALIDFGDALTGGLFYELAALHPGLFAGEKALLAAFLEAYGYTGPTGPWFARRAMTACLLHEFDVLNGLRDLALAARSATLEELAEQLWLV